MHRFRNALIATATVMACAAMACDTMAQQQGGGGGGGGGGGRGGRGGFGFGGFGGGPGGFGPGRSLLDLALNPAVQEEIKAKEPQKVKLAALSETVNQRRRQIMDQMRPQGQQGQGGRRNRNNNANDQAGGGGGGGGGFGGQNGGDPNGGGQNGGGQNGGGPGGGRGRGQIDPEMAARFTAMREAMTELQQGTDSSLAKILDRGQIGRVRQIQLQLDGLNALTRPDMVEKLALGEDQVVQIRELLSEGRQAQRENGRARFDMMKQAFPNGFGGGPGGPGGQNGGGQTGGDPNGGGQNGGGQNGGGGPGGRGGRGGPRGPNMRDPAVREAIQKFMEQPEVKAKMDQIQVQSDKIQSQLTAEVNRILGKRQAANYKRMLGARFDLALVRGGPGGRGPGGNRNPNQADAAKTASKAQASDSDDEDSETAKPAAKATKAAPAAKAKKKSLRALRGLDDE